MGNRIRFHRANAEGEKVSTNSFQSDKGNVRLHINEETLKFRVVAEDGNSVVAEGPSFQVNSHFKLKQQARKALKSLGVSIEDEVRAKRTKSQEALDLNQSN